MTQGGPFLVATPWSHHAGERQFASEPTLALRPARSYQFLVVAFVTMGFFSGAGDPISVRVETEYVRAAPGGTGAAKYAGNYAPAYLAQATAASAGCHQVVWLDAGTRESVEELGGMNLFFVHDSPGGPMVTTPPLSDTILAGVTRDSILALAASYGYEVREAPMTIAEWRAQATAGQLTEAFACGTAAGITPISDVVWKEDGWRIGNGAPGPVTMRIRSGLQRAQRDVSTGYGWLVRAVS